MKKIIFVLTIIITIISCDKKNSNNYHDNYWINSSFNSKHIRNVRLKNYYALNKIYKTTTNPYSKSYNSFNRNYNCSNYSRRSFKQ